MNSRRGKDVRAGWRALLLGGGLALGIAATAVGDERSAGLLPPRPTSTYVPRASGADLNPDELPPPVTTRSRDGDFTYPPSYSSTKKSSDFPEIHRLWNKLVSGKVFGDGEAKPPSSNKTADKTISHSTPSGIPGTTVHSPPGLVAPPAWRWYGYGAPVPGANPLAPNGIYGSVPFEWYQHTGATPGAVPLMAPPVTPAIDMPAVKVPAVPAPTTDALTAPVIAPPSDRSTSPAGGRPAEIQMPVRSTKTLDADSNFTPISLPLSARSIARQARAQAPETELVPAEIINGLRSTCAGLVERIELTPQGANKVTLRLKLANSANADVLADRIAKMPALAGYEIEMEFIRAQH